MSSSRSRCPKLQLPSMSPVRFSPDTVISEGYSRGYTAKGTSNTGGTLLFQEVIRFVEGEHWHLSLREDLLPQGSTCHLQPHLLCPTAWRLKVTIKAIQIM